MTDAPVGIMDRMNRVYKPYLDMFVIIFIDDILIYSRNEKDHASHLRIVLQTLKENELYEQFSMCEFWIKSVEILGHKFPVMGVSWVWMAAIGDLQRGFYLSRLLGCMLMQDGKVITYTSIQLKKYEKNYQTYDLE